MRKKFTISLIAFVLIIGTIPSFVFAQSADNDNSKQELKSRIVSSADKALNEYENNSFSLKGNYEDDDYTYLETEPNDTIQNANSVNEDDSFSGTLSGSDNDYFKINVSKKRAYSIYADSDSEYFCMTLLSKNNEQIQISESYGYDEEYDSYGYSIYCFNLNPGEYYLKVFDSEQADCQYDIYTESIPRTFIRSFGLNRYETSFSTANQLKWGDDYFQCVGIASGDTFADALPGSYISACYYAPILLSNGANTADIITYIQENMYSDGDVYILGGVGAIPASVDSALKKKGYSVIRLGGANRFATNLKILNETGLYDNQVLVCTGYDFADSLSASATGLPILLVGDSLTAEQKEFLASYSDEDMEYIMVGGVGAVSQKIENQLQAYGKTSRLSGNNRYETSIKVAEFAEENKIFNEEGAGPDTVVLAYAQNFPDGLCGGPLAYFRCAPLILTSDLNYKAAQDYVSNENITWSYILGGSSLISDKTVDHIFNMYDDEMIEENTLYF